MRISDWSSDVCSSDLRQIGVRLARLQGRCQKPHAMTDQTATPRVFSASVPLKGRIAIPGDKSISHRSLMLSAIAEGESRVTGKIGRAHVLTPVTNANSVCRLLLVKKNTIPHIN